MDAKDEQTMLSTNNNTSRILMAYIPAEANL